MRLKVSRNAEMRNSTKSHKQFTQLGADGAGQIWYHLSRQSTVPWPSFRFILDCRPTQLTMDPKVPGGHVGRHRLVVIISLSIVSFLSAFDSTVFPPVLPVRMALHPPISNLPLTRFRLSRKTYMAMRPIHSGWELPTYSRVQPYNHFCALYPMCTVDDSSCFLPLLCSQSAQLSDQLPRIWRQF